MVLNRLGWQRSYRLNESNTVTKGRHAHKVVLFSEFKCGGPMGKPIRYCCTAVLATLVGLGSAHGQTTSQTTCTGQFGTVNCTTSTSPEKPPLDYAKALQGGQDLVPPVQRKADVMQPQAAADEDWPITPFEHAGDLRTWCSARDQHFRTICIVYIHGVAEGFSGGLSLVEDKSHFCPPPGLTADDEKKAVMRWLDANPKAASAASGPVVAVALTRTYPCAKN